MRILFMGTPDIAAESLAALLEAGHEVCAVFTRRDKPVGRKQILTAPPVKQLAMERGIPVYQPRTLRDGSSDDVIKELAPDIIVVVAYGCIIPPQLLHAAKYGCINLHVSLLPKYRGSAPIQWSVLNGNAGTGVTIMQLDEGLDTGDMLVKKEIAMSQLSEEELKIVLQGICYQRLIAGGGVVDFATENYQEHSASRWNQQMDLLAQSGYIQLAQAQAEKIIYR